MQGSSTAALFLFVLTSWTVDHGPLTMVSSMVHRL
jgi:hypothetical protein